MKTLIILALAGLISGVMTFAVASQQDKTTQDLIRILTSKPVSVSTQYVSKN